MRSAALVLVVLLSACASGAHVAGPTTALPAPQPRAPQLNGAIFQDVSYRPLFEDRRARHVGDTLMVVINEKTNASRSGDMSASRNANATMSVPLVSKLGPAAALAGTGLNAQAQSKLEGKDGASASNLFTGSITVTVIDVLPNGNLVVAGEKRLGISDDTETLRFSGVVNPMHIVSGNTVSSTTVADARIEGTAQSHVSPERVLGFLGRFFLSFLPFR